MHLFNTENNTQSVYAGEWDGISGRSRVVDMITIVVNDYHERTNEDPRRIESIVDDRFLTDQDRQDQKELSPLSGAKRFATHAELLNCSDRIRSGVQLTESELETAYNQLHRHAVQTYHMYLKNVIMTNLPHHLEKSLIPLAIVCEKTGRYEEAERIYAYLLSTSNPTYSEPGYPHGQRLPCSKILWYVVSLARLQRRQGNIEQTIWLLQGTAQVRPVVLTTVAPSAPKHDPSPCYSLLTTHANPYWFDGQFSKTADQPQTTRLQPKKQGRQIQRPGMRRV